MNKDDSSHPEFESDPVSRMVRDCTAEELTDWLIKNHGLRPESRTTVVSNLRDQFRWHRLSGRLDRHEPDILDLLKSAFGSPTKGDLAKLETPERKPE